MVVRPVEDKGSWEYNSLLRYKKKANSPHGNLQAISSTESNWKETLNRAGSGRKKISWRKKFHRGANSHPQAEGGKKS